MHLIYRVTQLTPVSGNHVGQMRKLAVAFGGTRKWEQGRVPGECIEGTARGLSLGWQQTQQAIELDRTASTPSNLDRFLESRGRFTIQR